MCIRDSSKMFPTKGIGGAEFPAVLSGMIYAWGGDVIDYPERRHCCGFGFRQYLVMANRGYSVANSKKKFESMQPYEPDFIVANCPGSVSYTHLNILLFKIRYIQMFTHARHFVLIRIINHWINRTIHPCLRDINK